MDKYFVLFLDDSSEVLVGSHFATKPDGSIIDIVSNEGEDCLVGELSMPDGTSAEVPPDSLPQTEETPDSVDDQAVTEDDTAVAKFEVGEEGADIEGEVIEEQVIGPRMEEPLTPVTENFDVPKSLPESGKKNSHHLVFYRSESLM